MENNLYGIDLNEEAIEICRLSLWIKTAERGKVLTSLARTIEPAQRQAAEALTLEHRLSDLINAAYGLTPDEIALMWATAPPRMPFSHSLPLPLQREVEH
ncbi:MAG TPA: hypothetical protein VF278_08325 [Pirellulales bacterium]